MRKKRNPETYKPYTSEDVLAVVTKIEAGFNKNENVTLDRADAELICERLRTLLQMEEGLELFGKLN